MRYIQVFGDTYEYARTAAHFFSFITIFLVAEDTTSFIMDKHALWMVLFIILMLVIFTLLSLIPATMAKKRGRSSTGWFLFTFIPMCIFTFIANYLIIWYIIFTLASIIILAALGDTEERRKQKIWEQERIRQMAERQYSRKTEKYTEQEEPFFNPNAKTINDMYKGKNIKDLIDNS